MSNIETVVTGTYKNKAGDTVEKTSTIISNVYFAYTRIQKPVFKFDSKTEKEYKVTVFMDEDSAEEFEDAGFNKKVNTIKTSEFEGKYKFEAPFEGKKQYFVNFTADTKFKGNFGDFKAGDEVPYDYEQRPKVLAPLKEEKGYVFELGDETKDLTMTTEVGNGSKGKVAFGTYKHKGKLGVNFQSILVEDLVEYEAEEYDNTPRSAFGAVAGGYNSDDSQATQRDAEEIKHDPLDESDDIDFDDELGFDDEE